MIELFALLLGYSALAFVQSLPIQIIAAISIVVLATLFASWLDPKR